MMPQSTDITAYAFFAKLKALPFVEAIYLYGSRARGDHDDWSDIDLAVVCPSASPTQWHEVTEAVETEELLVPITVARYDTITDAGFKAQIDKDKKELYRRG
jgi:predicted nucleotidyltransferase